MKFDDKFLKKSDLEVQVKFNFILCVIKFLMI